MGNQKRQNEAVFRSRSRRHEFRRPQRRRYSGRDGVEDSQWRHLSDDQIAKVILEVIAESEAYGIMDIVTHLPGLIADLKPILVKYATIIMDSSLSTSEKVDAIWAHTKDSMLPIIKVVGKMAAKEILKHLVIVAAGALGR